MLRHLPHLALHNHRIRCPQRNPLQMPHRKPLVNSVDPECRLTSSGRASSLPTTAIAAGSRRNKRSSPMLLYIDPKTEAVQHCSRTPFPPCPCRIPPCRYPRTGTQILPVEPKRPYTTAFLLQKRLPDPFTLRRRRRHPNPRRDPHTPSTHRRNPICRTAMLHHPPVAISGRQHRTQCLIKLLVHAARLIDQNQRQFREPAYRGFRLGSPTMRDPFGNSSEIALSPSPLAFRPSCPIISAAFRTNSALCCAVGLDTSTRLPGLLIAGMNRLHRRYRRFAPLPRTISKSRASPPTAAPAPASHLA